MAISEKISELRKRGGYSQEQLAEKLGVSCRSVSKWESGGEIPDTDKIIADKRNFFGNHPSQCKIIRSAMPFCSGTENQEHSCRIDRIPMGTGNRQQFFCCRTIETGD